MKDNNTAVTQAKPNQVRRRKTPVFQLAGFLGAWGCVTSRIKNEDQMRRLACEVFGVLPQTRLDEFVASIADLGPRERKRRVAVYVAHHEPEPSPLWPERARARGIVSPTAPIICHSDSSVENQT